MIQVYNNVSNAVFNEDNIVAIINARFVCGTCLFGCKTHFSFSFSNRVHYCFLSLIDVF